MEKIPLKEERKAVFLQKVNELFRKNPELGPGKLAEMLGITYPYLFKVLNQDKPVSENLFTKFAEVFFNGNMSLKDMSGKAIAGEKALSVIEMEDGASKGLFFKKIPFYNLNVSAGDIVFLDNGLIQGHPPDDFLFIPVNIDADIALPVYGDSMYPKISNGDRIAVKLLKDKSFYNFGMKYLIITDEQRMVKYLRKHKDPQFVSLESENPKYDPIDMPMDSIKALFQVRYIGKTEM